MKPIGILSVLLLLVPFAAQAEEISLEVAFDAPVHDRTVLGDVLAVSGAGLHALPGEPLLPERAFTFILPQGHVPANVRVESASTEILADTYDIAPAQLPVPLSGRFRPLITPRDALIYDSSNAYPENWAEVGPVQYKRGFALVGVIVHPLSYRPATGRVERLVSARLVLTTRPGGRVSPLLRDTADDDAAVLQSADVATALGTYAQRITRGPLQLPPGDYPYLIVTPQAYENLGGEYSLEALRDARTAEGLTGNIVTVEWIQANYAGTRPDGGQDDATRIREFLTDAYAEWNTSYVLLVGDADGGDEGGESGDNLLPVRGLYVDPRHPEAAADHLPSDLYYACLDGTFDNDADGIYGEENDGVGGGEVDLMAELYVGRLPADRVSEVQDFVAKTLYYEAGAGVWLQDVLMVGELLWDDPMEVWGGDAMDELITGSDVGGYITLGFDSFPFFVCSTLYDRDQPQGEYWEAQDLTPLLDAGPHIVNHLGHSNNTYNMRLMNNNVNDLINTHPFLHYSQGCYNGAFDNCLGPEYYNRITTQDCIAEHLVTEAHGAFATISNSRYGWGSFMADGPSQRFHREFWDAFFGEGMSTIGQAHFDSKEDSANVFDDPYYRWVGFESNLLGDPAVVLKKSLNTTDPLLGLYPPQASFIVKVGDAAPDPVTIGVRNDGVGTLSFSAVSDQSWATVTPGSGDAPLDVEVHVDPAGLPAGAYQALLTFTSAEAANSPVDMTVTLTVVEVPEILVPHIASAPVVDGAISPGEYDQALSFAIDPDANGQVVLYLAVSGTRLHVAVDDHLDESSAEYDRFRLFFDKYLDGFWPTAPADEGYYDLSARDGGRLSFYPVFNSGGGAQSDRRNRERDPPGFAGVPGFQDGHRVYEISLDLEITHLDVGPAGTFGLYLDASNSEMWGEGTVTGSWPPVVPEIDDQMYFGRVDMTPQGAWLHASPGDLYFEGVEERTAPAPATLSVSELLGGTVNFTASSSVSWLQVSPASGQTPQDLTVTADQTGLPAGTYEGQVVLESNETGNAQHAVPVVFEVLPRPPRLSVSPLTLEVSVVLGDPDPDTLFVVENIGGVEMNVQITPAETWVTTPGSLLVSPGTSQDVAVQLSLEGMDIGTYSAEILVEAPDAEDSPATVTVQLEIKKPNSAPPAPLLMAPANGDELYGPIDLMAYPVTDPDGDQVTYQFELMASASGDLVDSGAGMDDSSFIYWQPTAQLEENVLYRWRVKATDEHGAESGWSEERAFLVIAEPSSGDDCGCGGRTPSVGFVFILLGLLVLRFSGRRG